MTAHTPIGLDPDIIKARKPKRLPAGLDVKLRTAGGSIIPARLVDFSHRGFGIECKALVLIGSTVELSLPKLGWVEGTVRWSIGNRVGGWFTREIEVEELIFPSVRKRSKRTPAAG